MNTQHNNLNAESHKIIQTIKSTPCVKSIELESGLYLYFWYSNNRGNGKSNVTIILSYEMERAARSASQNGVIAITKTSAWRGHVNLSRQTLTELGMGE